MTMKLSNLRQTINKENKELSKLLRSKSKTLNSQGILVVNGVPQAKNQLLTLYCRWCLRKYFAYDDLRCTVCGKLQL